MTVHNVPKGTWGYMVDAEGKHVRAKVTKARPAGLVDVKAEGIEFSSETQHLPLCKEGRSFWPDHFEPQMADGSPAPTRLVPHPPLIWPAYIAAGVAIAVALVDLLMR